MPNPKISDAVSEPVSVAEKAARPRKLAASQVLTISTNDEAVLPGAEEDVLWHELTNAYLTHKVLSGILGGIERIGDSNNGLAIIYYKNMRVAIPLSEMFVNLPDDQERYAKMARRVERIVTVMMGCEVDFIIRGLDEKSRSVVGSRKDAMLRKQRTFYLTPGVDSKPQIYPDRIVQARVIAVAEKAIRIEVFGVECTVSARLLSWQWIGDAHELYTVGDVILVKVSSVDISDPAHITIEADPRSITENTVLEKLKSVKEQDRYAGQVTDVHKGMVFIRLYNGINAVSHSCLDERLPAKRDHVSFVVTHVNLDQGVVVGIVTRIIRQEI